MKEARLGQFQSTRPLLCGFKRFIEEHLEREILNNKECFIDKSKLDFNEASQKFTKKNGIDELISHLLTSVQSSREDY